jgi:hypothetical protein
MIVVTAIGISAFFALGGAEKVRTEMYKYQAKSALKKADKELGDPLGSFGFTDIVEMTVCTNDITNGIDDRKQTECVAMKTASKVFTDEASKSAALAAAKELTITLKEKIWSLGQNELGTWMEALLLKGAVSQSDSNYLKPAGNKFCKLEFYAGSTEPSAPGVTARLYCTVPDIGLE